MYFVLQILEAQRQALRHPRAPQREVDEPTEAEKPAITAELHRLARSAPPELAADLRRIAGRLKDAGAREKAQQRLFIEGYSELAAVGQAAIGLSRAVQPILVRCAIIWTLSATLCRLRRILIAQLPLLSATSNPRGSYCVAGYPWLRLSRRVVTTGDARWTYPSRSRTSGCSSSRSFQSAKSGWYRTFLPAACCASRCDLKAFTGYCTS